MNICKPVCILFVLLLVRVAALADEGMWLPQLLESLNEKQMKKLGMKIDAADIYSINKGSLKDAIVSFGGFCTAEVISGKGLILTNHHCGNDNIQNHTTLQNNYLRDGFWARSHSEELPNKGLTATFIIRIDDVTNDVLQGVTAGLTESERQRAIDKNIDVLRKNAKKEAYQDVIIRPFFEGNKYYQFITEVYRDVRLVGAPPSSIGNFGKDTDNWMWPRHTGDFSLFRIYAGRDNKPAAYSPDNVPYKPKRSLSISLDGVNKDDFTFVFGFPGRTYQYLHSSAVAQILNVNDPAKIAIRDVALTIMDESMRRDEQIKIHYAAKYASVQNAYKKWQGEILGLARKDALKHKKAYEEEFQKRVTANPVWNQKYSTLLSELEATYNAFEPYGLSRDYYNETVARIELFTAANRLRSVVNAYENNGLPGYDTSRQRISRLLHDLYEEYHAPLDQKLFAALMQKFVQDQGQDRISPYLKQLLADNNSDFNALAAELYQRSIIVDSTQVFSLLNLPPAEAVNRIKADPGFILIKEMQDHYVTNVGGQLGQLQSKINALQRNYMQAQMEVFTEKAFYPDANSTLRVTYGQAKGYKARNAVNYAMYTYLEGVMEKYIPGDYEFDVPAKLIDLYNKKDFGRYGVNGKMPVCFIATNHTTGGNSGSPALDAHGNLVGLNFDRVWEGTMSDIYYDGDICRNIMVDARYIVFIIDKFAGAQNIVDELKLVHPKKNKKK